MLNCDILKCNMLKCDIPKCDILECNILKCDVLKMFKYYVLKLDHKSVFETIRADGGRTFLLCNPINSIVNFKNWSLFVYIHEV